MPVETTSEIEHVTVYARGARVRRVTPPGVVKGEIRITGLPLGIVDDTVRAEVVGEGIVTSIRVELDAASPAQRADDALDQAVRAAKTKVTTIDAEVARLVAALEGLDALAPAARRARPSSAEVPSWSRMFD